MYLETESKISLLVTLIQRFVTQIKLSIIFTKTLLFPHKTAYFLNKSYDMYKNADCDSKFTITKSNRWKSKFWKQQVWAKGETKVIDILAIKCEVKAMSFIIPISFYGCKISIITFIILVFFFFKDIFIASK